MTSDHTHPAGVVARLEAIERDMAERQNAYEQAADDRARAIRDWDKRVAIHMRVAKGANAETRKANGLTAAIEQDQLYERLSDAEARFDALRVVMRTLEARSVIGTAILKAQGRAA